MGKIFDPLKRKVSKPGSSDANLLENISNTKRFMLLLQMEKLLDRKELDRILAEVKEAAEKLI